jgi:endoglucanase
MPRVPSALRAAAALTLAASTIAAAVLVAGPAQAQAQATVAPRSATPLTASQIRSAANSTLFPGGLYTQADSVAAGAASTLAAQGDATGAASAAIIAKRPVAIWLGDWFQGARLVSYIQKNLDVASAAGKTAVFVTYAIPDRDCGGYSAGGLTESTYLDWNSTIATTLRGHHAVVLVEPDSLGQTTSSCSSIAASRIALIESAVQTLAANGVAAYLDGGNSRWLKPAQMASLLNQAGIASARGFYTNVANYIGVDDERAYADQISALTGGSHYVIDVSRNGAGWKGTWCNAPGAGLGQDPHVTAGSGKLDALLWVKTPGSSDGTCNGGPAAGAWYASYATSLVAHRK